MASCASIEDEKENPNIQTKLTIGLANDVYEQEADRVAEQIMRMPDQLEQTENEQPHTGINIQRIANSGGGSLGVDSDIQLSENDGQPLSLSTRQFMEPRFGIDFGHVRLHSDEHTQRTAAKIQARAFTYGPHIWLGKGESEHDKGLIAHELTHVMQQSKGTKLTRKTRIHTSQHDHEQMTTNTEVAMSSDSRPEVLTLEPPRLQRAFLDALGCTRLPDPNTGILVCFSLPGPTGCEGRGGTCTQRGPGGVLGCLCEFPSPPLPVPTPLGPPPVLPPGSVSPLTLPTLAVQSPAPAPAPAQMVTDITVANQADAITYPEPSNLGAAGRTHFVTVAGSGPEVIVEATLTPDGTPSPGSVTWTGATPDPGNPARATVSRARAGKHEVTASAGGGSASLTVWAIFASVHNVNGPTLGFSPPAAAPAGTACQAGDFCVWATVNFDARIFPPEIITDEDRPNLAGARTIAPPGGTHPCGNPLAGGAPLRWDFSRQVRFVPGGIIAAECGGGAAFPANNAEGNDDSHADDEMNDPYAGGAIPQGGRAVPAGSVGDSDAPSLNLSHADGLPANPLIGFPGSTATLVSDFREFVRLEYHRTWWLISHRPTWGVRFRLRKDATNHWVDDGSAVV